MADGLTQRIIQLILKGKTKQLSQKARKNPEIAKAIEDTTKIY